MKVTFDIRGNKELMSKLNSLPQKMEKRVIRQAVRATQKTMVPAVQSNARSMLANSKYPDAVDMSELIAKNIIVRAARKQKRGSYAVNVLMRAGVNEFLSPGKNSGRISYIPAAIEYGHMAGPTYVPAIPFARSAAESTANDRMRMFTNQLRIGLLREAIKAR